MVWRSRRLWNVIQLLQQECYQKLCHTYSGMMAAMVGGLVVSVVLYTLKRTMVREVLVFETRDYWVANKYRVPVPVYRWVTVNPA